MRKGLVLPSSYMNDSVLSEVRLALQRSLEHLTSMPYETELISAQAAAGGMCSHPAAADWNTATARVPRPPPIAPERGDSSLALRRTRPRLARPVSMRLAWHKRLHEEATHRSPSPEAAKGQGGGARAPPAARNGRSRGGPSEAASALVGFRTRACVRVCMRGRWGRGGLRGGAGFPRRLCDGVLEVAQGWRSWPSSSGMAGAGV